VTKIKEDGAAIVLSRRGATGKLERRRRVLARVLARVLVAAQGPKNK
jgi:hypothetical protein